MNIPELSFYNSSPEYFVNLSKDKEFISNIMDNVYNTIIVSLNKKRIPNRIKLFKVKFENSFLIVQKEDYKSLINTLIEFYEQKEDYKKCELCKKVLNNL